MVLDLIEVGWADDIVEVVVHRRPHFCGDIYTVAFNNIAHVIIGHAPSHEQQDKEAMEYFTKLLNDEQAARKAFHVTE